MVLNEEAEFFIHLPKEEENERGESRSALIKEFHSQIKTEDDLSRFLKKLRRMGQIVGWNLRSLLAIRKALTKPMPQFEA